MDPRSYLLCGTPSFRPTRSATSRRCSLSGARRLFTSASVSADAVSVEPESNGGEGSYSICNWIWRATSSPSRMAATASAKSIPEATPAPVMTLPSMTTRWLTGNGAERS